MRASPPVRLGPVVLAALLLSGLWLSHHASWVPLGGLGNVAGAEEEAAPTPRVTDEDLDLYIDVYKALQADHRLKLADELKRRGIELAEFRRLERRIQADRRHVEKVRRALLEFARSRMEHVTATPPAGTPSAAE